MATKKEKQLPKEIWAYRSEPFDKYLVAEEDVNEVATARRVVKAGRYKLVEEVRIGAKAIVTSIKKL